ncbi:hypothetical protein [Leifsonia sp. AG29]|uniref:hypothetical protein n=1 Tax=Leifsonia sp. AG29 TaxID=2598860 RepID=UPI00131C3C22|nr:hypothetical protein [Leifsonia sp. AG29]
MRPKRAWSRLTGALVALGLAVTLLVAPAAQTAPAASAAPAEVTCATSCTNVPATAQAAAESLLNSWSSGSLVVESPEAAIIPSELQPIANGTIGATPQCNVDARTLQLLVVVIRNYGSVQISDLNRRCANDGVATCASNPTSYHCLPSTGTEAVDITYVGGQRTRGNDDASAMLLRFLDSFLPQGSRAGQAANSNGCGNYSMPALLNISRFADYCTHLHVDLGPTTTPLRLTRTDSLVRLSGTTTVYLVSGNQRFRFASADLLAQYTNLGPVKDVSAATFNSYVDGPTVQRTIRTSDGSIYLIDANKRYRFSGCAQATDFGQPCDGIPTISLGQLSLIPDGGYLASLVKLPDGSIWLMQGGQRRQTPNPAVLAPYGIPATTTSLSNFSIGSVQVGLPVVGVGAYTDGQGNVTAVTAGGTYSVTAAAAAGTLPSRSVPLQVESYQRLYPSGSLPLRLASSGRFFVAVDGGWLEVGATNFGGLDYFTAGTDGSWTGLPLVATTASPLFIRERSSSQVYLMSGGIRQAVADQSALNWISVTFGVPATVWVAADGALRGLAPAEGPIVNETGTQNNYLIDAGKRYKIRDCAQLAAWGRTCGQIPSLPTATITQYPLVGTLTDLVKQPTGTIWLVQGGQRRETPDPSVLAMYWIPATTTTLSSGVIGSLPVGAPVLRAGIYSDGGANVANVTYGGTFSMAGLTGPLVTAATKLQPASYQQLGATAALPPAMVSDGRYFVAVDSGWLEVSAATLGGPAAFTAAPSNAWTGMPFSAKVTAPFFLRAPGSSSIFLISGGYKQPVADQGAANWLAAYYGLSNKVWVAAGDVLSRLK